MSEPLRYKQVIVVRSDLKMRRGKEVAQGCHASVGALDRARRDWPDHVRMWEEEGTSKICVRVDSEEELLEVYGAAVRNWIPCHLVTDSGRTEFNGVPTMTCCAIGPGPTAVIDKITGDLRLY